MKTTTLGFDIYDNTSVKNVRFEDHDSIITLPVMWGTRTIDWLKENNIPFERMKACDIPAGIDRTFVLGGVHFNYGFGLKTNINPDDLRMMTLTLAMEDRDDCKEYASTDNESDKKEEEEDIDLFADVPEEDGWTDFC